MAEKYTHSPKQMELQKTLAVCGLGDCAENDIILGSNCMLSYKSSLKKQYYTIAPPSVDSGSLDPTFLSSSFLNIPPFPTHTISRAVLGVAGFTIWWMQQVAPGEGSEYGKV